MNTPNTARMPVFFLSHGGGPWPYIDGMREQYAQTEREFKNLPARTDLSSTVNESLIIELYSK